MARLIDADALREHLFVGFDFDKAIDDGIPKTEKEILAFWCGWNDALKSVVRFAPTVDPVKHGHWVEVQRIHETDHTAICECSLCGDTVWVYDGQRAWNYCPNCGAKMDEVEDMTKEAKMQIVIDNYFKSECDVNTSIRKAFEKGFRIGVQKGSVDAEPVKHGRVIDGKCSVCNHKMNAWACDFVYCPYCKAKMDEVSK